MKCFEKLLLCLLLLSSSWVKAAKPDSWKDDFNKTEFYLKQGDYQNALKRNKLFLQQWEKSTAHKVASPAAHFQAARIYNGLGDFAQYQKNCQHAMQYIDNSANGSEDEYAFALIESIKTLMDFGNVAGASALAKKASLLARQKIIKNPPYLFELNYLQAQVYFHQGFFLKALELTDSLKRYTLKRVVTKEAYKDPKTGTQKWKKLSSAEANSRKREYVDVLHLEIKLLHENGRLSQADSLHTYCNGWIEDHLGMKDFAMVENLFIKGMLHERKGEEKEAYKAYTSALDLYATSKGLHYTHYCKETGRLFQKCVLIEEQVGKGKEGSKDQVSYDSKIKRYFGKKNFYFAQTILLEAEKNFISGEYAEAKKSMTALLSKNDLIPDLHQERARGLQLLYALHLLEDDYASAEKDLTEVIKIKKELLGEESPMYHKAKLELADFEVHYSNKFSDAESIFILSLQEVVAKEISHSSLHYIQSAFAQSKLYQVTEQYEKAERLSDKIIDEIKKYFGTEHINFSIALQKSADLDIDMGHFLEAEKKLNTSIAYFKTHDLHSNIFYKEYISNYITIARLQIIEGNYEEAEKSLKKANKLSKEYKDQQFQKYGNGAEEMVSLYMHTGRYQEAGKTLNEFVKQKELRFGSFSRNLINPYNLLGNLQLITGDYATAEQLVHKAQSISQSIFGDSSLRYAESLKILENIYTAIGDYERAEDAIKKVIHIQTTKYGPHHVLVANTLNDLALIKFLNKGNPQEVENLFNQSLSIIRTSLGEKTPQYADVLKNLSQFLLETGRINEAETYLEKINAFWIEKLGKSNIHTAGVFMLQGNILFLKAKYLDARTKYADSKGIYASIFDNYHPLYVKALSRVGQMNYIIGDYKTCAKNYEETTGIYLDFIKKYFPSLSEREKNKFWSTIKNDFEFYNSLALKLRASNPEVISNMYNFTLNTKAILLNSSIKVKERIFGSKDTLLIKKYENWVEKKEYLVSIISMSNEQRKANLIDLKAVEKEVEGMEKELSSSSELFVSESDRQKVFNWEKVKENLLPNEVAIEMVRFRKFHTSFTDTICYAALAITAQTKGHPELILFENGKDLETKLIKYYRNSIRLKTDDLHSYKNFWEPFTKSVKDNATIYLSPDGIFTQINLETIKAPDGKYIIDKNDLILISSSRDLIRNVKTQKAKKEITETEGTEVSLFGNPTYYNTLQKTMDGINVGNTSRRTITQLPGAEKEVKELYNLLQSSKWQPKLYLENDAEEEIVKNMKSPKVFHIATHGFYLEDDLDKEDNLTDIHENRHARNPLLCSGLLLKNGGKLMEHDNVYDFNQEDGILTAYEAMNLNLDKTDLVVLSACETGLGDIQQGEGVYGLQRSFQVAGAKSIIMSLFKVSDDVTQELMFTFYKKWIATGDKRKSFAAAKKEIKDKYPEPIYWGSFVMVGVN